MNEDGPTPVPELSGDELVNAYDSAFADGMQAWDALAAAFDYHHEEGLMKYDYYEQKRLAKQAANEVLLQYGESHSPENVVDAVLDVVGDILVEEIDKIAGFARHYIENAIVVVSFHD